MERTIKLSVSPEPVVLRKLTVKQDKVIARFAFRCMNAGLSGDKLETYFQEGNFLGMAGYVLRFLAGDPDTIEEDQPAEEGKVVVMRPGPAAGGLLDEEPRQVALEADWHTLLSYLTRPEHGASPQLAPEQVAGFTRKDTMDFVAAIVDMEGDDHPLASKLATALQGIKHQLMTPFTAMLSAFEAMAKSGPTGGTSGGGTSNSSDPSRTATDGPIGTSTGSTETPSSGTGSESETET